MKQHMTLGLLMFGLTVAACTDGTETLIVDGQKRREFSNPIWQLASKCRSSVKKPMTERRRAQ